MSRLTSEAAASPVGQGGRAVESEREMVESWFIL